MRGNVLKILTAEIVFLNVTPRELNSSHVVNPGVLIEYGLVQRQARSLAEIRSPRPFYRLFITRYSRTTLPPLLNEEDVVPFKKSTRGKQELVSAMVQLMSRAADEIVGTTKLTPAAMERETIFQEEI